MELSADCRPAILDQPAQYLDRVRARGDRIIDQIVSGTPCAAKRACASGIAAMARVPRASRLNGAPVELLLGIDEHREARAERFRARPAAIGRRRAARDSPAPGLAARCAPRSAQIACPTWPFTDAGKPQSQALRCNHERTAELASEIACEAQREAGAEQRGILALVVDTEHRIAGIVGKRRGRSIAIATLSSLSSASWTPIRSPGPLAETRVAISRASSRSTARRSPSTTRSSAGSAMTEPRSSSELREIVGDARERAQRTWPGTSASAALSIRAARSRSSIAPSSSRAWLRMTWARSR
jgi:hypothetical protein